MNRAFRMPGFVLWQRSYFDHIIRDAEDHVNHQRYILEKSRKVGCKTTGFSAGFISGNNDRPPSLCRGRACRPLFDFPQTLTPRRRSAGEQAPPQQVESRLNQPPAQLFQLVKRFPQ